MVNGEMPGGLTRCGVRLRRVAHLDRHDRGDIVGGRHGTAHFPHRRLGIRARDAHEAGETEKAQANQSSMLHDDLPLARRVIGSPREG